MKQIIQKLGLFIGLVIIIIVLIGVIKTESNSSNRYMIDHGEKIEAVMNPDGTISQK